ncbi:MAG: dTDP-glucose 4,6-dehydratase [uncultured bacterium]|uniref:UDP-glucose 4-epimerase n=1 Tax=Berkelbacteria bacterium GW2011_GWA2_38_9 TaxID=1618334 RepID=A0A0G0LEL9_9BACT|nr:MAG: dTDP-glucose 4,6-dehydratase [uncultured bacterium]KKQ90323.1 MAG: UDP-glucose 4-epimerase [Berkelbacteria bacterium GW2011_GWA2_38_9]
MKILITGGAGFIGSQVADKFIEKGHQVAIIDNLSTGFKENLNPKAKFYEVDLENAEDVRRAIAEFQPEVIDHHAAQVDVRKAVEDPVMDAKKNILGGLNLLQAALDQKVQKFIYANSGGAGYGDPEELPCTEKSPIKPISPYGVTKMCFEMYLHFAHVVHGLNFVSLRYPNVFGPRQTFGEAGVVAIFTHLMLKNEQPTIFGDGLSTRDYCFVGDIMAANLLALENNQAAGAYNVGTGEETSVNKVFEVIKSATNYQGEPIYADPRSGEIQRIVLDSTRLRSELGWSPSVTFEEGITETIKWHKSHKL